MKNGIAISGRGNSRLRVVLVSSLLIAMLSPTAMAQTKQDIQLGISKDGKLLGGNNYSKLVEVKYGKRLRVVPAKTNLRSGASCSRVTEVGDHPDGFGKMFEWCQDENEVELVAFLNAADEMGIEIRGVNAGDEITIKSALGIASFAEDTGNPLASSIVGLIAAGAGALAPEAAPFILAAENFAKEQFKASNVKTRRRDAFGVHPDSGKIMRPEGGIIVCMPEAGGAYYSGTSSNTKRWIKLPPSVPDHPWVQAIESTDKRADERRPDHVVNGFFPIQGNFPHNRRVAHGTGQIYVLAWDAYFGDNAGYYKVFIHLKRGTLREPKLDKPRTTRQP